MMQLTDNNIETFADSMIVDKGRSLYLENRVTLNRVELDHFDALVKDNQTYEVRVRQTPYGLFALCTCPSWANCEHSVAALYAARDYYNENVDELIHHKTHPSWESFFNSLPVPHDVTVQPDESAYKWKIVYLLKLDVDEWSIVPQKVYLKKSGELGRLTHVGRFEEEDNGVKYSTNDLMVISYLTRLNAGEQISKWNTPPYPFDFRPVFYPYGGPEGHIFDYLDNGRLYTDEGETLGTQLTVSSAPCRFEFSYREEEDHYEWIPEMVIGEDAIRLNPNFSILTRNPVWILYEDHLYKVSNLSDPSLLLPFTQERLKIKIPKTEFSDFVCHTFPKLTSNIPLKLPKEYTLKTVNTLTGKSIVLEEHSPYLRVHLVTHYDPVSVHHPNFYADVYVNGTDDNTFYRIDRDQEQEQAIRSTLQGTGLSVNEEGIFQIPEHKTATWVTENIPDLMARGFEIHGLDHLQQVHIRTSSPTIKVQVDTQIDWFDLNLEIDFEGVRMSLKELRRSIRNQQKYVKLRDGSLAILPDSWIKKFRHLFHFAEVDQDHLLLPQHQVTLIDILFNQADSAHADQAFLERTESLKQFTGIEKTPLPGSMNQVLRPYQIAGYDWLNFLRGHKFGGCLADDMGLGKTLQTLALLLHEKRESSPPPSLIVCPTSVVFNWQQEVQKFTPSLTILPHVGLDRAKDTQSFRDYDIILTSYGIMRRDIAMLKSYPFHYVILDESQKIKNPHSQTSKASRLLKGSYPLALTGTPIENNTQELWSQFAFLNPGLLGSLQSFKRSFIHPIEKEGDQETAEFLKRLVFPFILRRTKENVAVDLPPKTEQTVYCTMNTRQEQLYSQWRDYYRSLILNQIDEQGLDRSRMNVLEGLVRLRQIACHPNLIEPSIREDSGKFEHMKEFVDEILAENHKILIFSQFVKMLKLMRKHFDRKDIPYAYLDGHTVNREQVVERFQNDDRVKLFLISLKAGGTGLNLTAADYVILYDPWWNPAVELQAMDRAHRIGQDKKVFVYRLISQTTVEEKMLDLQKRKRDLVSNLISTDSSFFKSLTREDVEILFS
jgi:non-specific serine/threonine protein kinase